jgi:hypothetical protein
MSIQTLVGQMPVSRRQAFAPLGQPAGGTKLVSRQFI